MVNSTEENKEEPDDDLDFERDESDKVSNSFEQRFNM